ncbi:MAG: serpin family protein [Planctomycetes bacterium]|nr:serpin family protein [Planctomycetota bacterium]
MRNLLLGAVGVMAASGFAPGLTMPSSPAEVSQQKESAERLGVVSSEFATDLLRALRADGQKGNLFFSPSSIHAALAMARVGASEATRDELSNVMGIHKVAGKPSVTDESFRSFAELLKTEATIKPEWLPENAQPLALTQAAALWASADSGMKPEASKTLEHVFTSPTEMMNFAKPKKVAETINDWASVHTRKRITHVVDAGDIPPSGLILTTAIYFKASWWKQFDRTHDMMFNGAGTPRQVTTMMNERNYPYAKIKDGQVVWLPYVGQAEMMVVLPDEGKFEQVVTELNLNEIKKGHPGVPVIVTMPLFSLSSNLQLKSSLAKMGLSTAMDPSAADFTNFTDVKPTYIDKVIHVANCDVDEKGTEAAAVTAVIAVTGAPAQQEPPRPIRFTADRPFVFFIRHSSGVVLFGGVVQEPIAPTRK